VRAPFDGGILEGVVRAVPAFAAFALATLAVGPSACAPAAVVVTPSNGATSTCPIGGCARAGDSLDAVSAPASPFVCSRAGDAPCSGAAATECTERALTAWSEASDDREVACVARMLAESCALDEPRACGFAGRLWLDGRGVARDARRGIEMLVRACDGGVAMACTVTASWLGDASHATELGASAQDLLARVEGQRTCILGQAEACFQIGVLFYYGRDSFPRDRAKSSRAFARGCDLGDSRACNNIGDALAYGDGVGRDVEGASGDYLKACRLGEALGCANLGYMTEHGEGVARDRSRARVLYRDACSAGDVYGCLHVELLAAEDAGAPRAARAAFAHWRQRCDAGHDARACAFVGLMFEDGPEGVDRDEAKSLDAMTRACALGDGRACEWVRSHPD
jgi:TPR repeat protein